METALFKVPQVVCYKTSTFSYLIGRLLIRNLKYISLVNLILEKGALVELIQNDCSFEKLVYHLEILLKKNSLKKVNEDYHLLRSKIGGKGASKKTAELIFDAIK